RAQLAPVADGAPAEDLTRIQPRRIPADALQLPQATPLPRPDPARPPPRGACCDSPRALLLRQLGQLLAFAREALLQAWRQRLVLPVTHPRDPNPQPRPRPRRPLSPAHNP